MEYSIPKWEEVVCRKVARMSFDEVFFQIDRKIAEISLRVNYTYLLGSISNLFKEMKLLAA